MPDFVDKVFDYTNYAYQNSLQVLQVTYDMSKDVLVSGYDKSRTATKVITEKTKDAYHKISPPCEIPFPPPTTMSSYNVLKGFVTSHKVTIGLCTALPLVSCASYLTYRHFYPYQRRALKLDQHTRFEVVLVVGSMESHFVNKLVNDLNTRGYIVFVTVTNEKQLKIVESAQDDDIKPLIIDYKSDVTVRSSLLKLGQLLDSRIANESEYYYDFRGCIFVPDYMKLPKISRMEELNSKEYIRVMESHFLKFNMLLGNGLLVFLQESNVRKETVANNNKLKIKNGFSKLLFINFVVYSNNDTRRLVSKLALNINTVLFNELYAENRPSYLENFLRSFGYISQPEKIDMAMLNVECFKDEESKLLNNSNLMSSIFSTNKRLSSRSVHYKVFDLLNSYWLSSQYVIKN